MDFELAFGFILLVLGAVGIVLVIVLGFRYILALFGLISILVGMYFLFEGLSNFALFPLGISFLFSGGLLIVVSNLMQKSKEHEKLLKEIIFKLQAVQKNPNFDEANL